MAKNIIETFDLSKKYILRGQNKEIIALNKANISIKEGEIFGLLGPNGAGKTTMIKILTTLIQPSSGYAIIDGDNILNNTKKIRTKIGLMLDCQMLYNRITGFDNLKFCCKIYDIPDYKKKIYRIAKDFNLKKWLNQYVHNYSMGMKMKLALCRTLLIDRKILFLDEPTFNLDLKSKAFIIDTLKKVNKTIFLTSHDMYVIKKLCDRIAFIKNGEINRIGTKNDIKRFMQKGIKVKIGITENKSGLISDLSRQEFISEITNNKDNITFTLKRRNYFQDLFSILSKYKILRIKEQDLSLEDIFLKIT
ncbi:MAG: ATP-binding cassette domain-containing protein [Promethearchaeota archaeon]